MSPFCLPQPTTFPIGTMNSYLFLEPEPVLIDCSVHNDEALSSLVSGLSSHGLKLSDLKKVIITHAHSDHMGLIGPLSEQSDAEIWVNSISRPWATDSKERWGLRADLVHNAMTLAGFPAEMVDTAANYTRRVLASYWSTADPDRLVEFPIDGRLEFGGRTWEVVYTPGHAISHTAFYQPEDRVMISGDILLPRIPMPLVEEKAHDPAERMHSLPRLAGSLRLLESMAIDIAYPGHGPVITNGRVIIREQLARIDTRRRRCRALVAAGHQTVWEVTQELYGHILKHSPYFAFCLTLGYLDLLEERGEVEKEAVGGVWRFGPRV